MQHIDMQHVLVRHEQHQVSHGHKGEKQLLRETEIQQVVGEGIENGYESDEDGTEDEHADGISGQIVGESRGGEGEVDECRGLQQAKGADQVGPRQAFFLDEKSCGEAENGDGGGDGPSESAGRASRECEAGEAEVESAPSLRDEDDIAV